MEKFSEISELRSEVDEWAALNKYAVYQSHKEHEERAQKRRDAKLKIKSELDK